MALILMGSPLNFDYVDFFGWIFVDFSPAYNVFNPDLDEFWLELCLLEEGIYWLQESHIL